MNNEFFSELRQIFGHEIGAGLPSTSADNPHLSSALRGTEAGTSPPCERCPMFTEDFHPLYGSDLCVFPRHATIQIPGEDIISSATFWPDLNTYLVGGESRQLMYYPPSPSRYSLHILWNDKTSSYRTAIFEDFDCIHEITGSEIAETLSRL